MAEKAIQGFVSWDEFEKVGIVSAVVTKAIPGDLESEYSFPEFDILASPEGFLAVDGASPVVGQWDNGSSLKITDQRSAYIYAITHTCVQTTVTARRDEHLDQTDPGRMHRFAIIKPKDRSFSMGTTGAITDHPEFLATTRFLNTDDDVHAKLGVSTDKHESLLSITVGHDGVPVESRIYSTSFLREIGATINSFFTLGDERVYLDGSTPQPQLAFNALATHLGHDGATGIDVRQSAIATYERMTDVGFDPMSAIVFK